MLRRLLRSPLPNGLTAIPLGRHTELICAPTGEPAWIRKQASAREIRIYLDVLPGCPAGAPALLAAAPAAPRGWLLLEYLPGAHPDLACPQQAARAYARLGQLHRRLAPTARGLQLVSPAAGPATPDGVERLLLRHPRTRASARRLARCFLPATPTLLHGDFHHANLLWQGRRLRLLDWEHGGTGHPIYDLLLPPVDDGTGEAAQAALTAYHQAGPLQGMDWPAYAALHRTALLCRAVQRAAMHRGQLREAAAEPAIRVILVYLTREEERIERLLDGLCPKQ